MQKALSLTGCALLAVFTLFFNTCACAQGYQPQKAESGKIETASNANVRSSITEITDSRSNGKFFKEMKVEIRLEGDDLPSVFGTGDLVVTEATDDTGKSLVKDKESHDSLLCNFNKNKKREDSLTFDAKLMNPARRATNFSLKGYVDLLDPAKEPVSVFSVSRIMDKIGQQVMPPVLQKHGLELTVMNKELADKNNANKISSGQKQPAMPQDQREPQEAMEQAFAGMFEAMFSGLTTLGKNDILFVIKDPKNLIAYLEATDDKGLPIESNGRSFSQLGPDAPVHYVLSFKAPLPSSAALKIYFVTEKSVTRVPVKFETVPLP